MQNLNNYRQETKENLEWLNRYSRGNLSNHDKTEMIEHYLNLFKIPKHNQQELVTSGHTLVQQIPLFSLLELFCKAMGLQVEYIKVGQKEHLSLRTPKGFYK